MLKESKKKVKEILLNTIERPSCEQVLELNESEIVKIAKGIGYKFPVRIMKKIYNVHKAFMPFIENGLVSLLSENEEKNPDYYAFARDGELIFDALWGVGQAGENELSKRIYYLKTSVGMMMNKDNSEKETLKYLKEIGITKSRFKKGPLMIFIDSGFEGTLFHSVGKWAGYNGNLPNKNLQGYLINKSSSSLFKQINLNQTSKDKIEIEGIMNNSPYVDHISVNFNRMVCAFMQLMPKFTGRYVKSYEKGDGSWDVLPEQNLLGEDLVSKLNISKKNLNSNINNQYKNADQYNSIKIEPSWINADIVNSLASLLLQKRTLNYFTDPNVHDRVYDLIKKK